MHEVRLVSCVLIGLALASLGRADDKVKKTGLHIGAKAPAFALKDQNGQERGLDEFLKKGNVALVFYRSASW